jgi:hypothetical protein
MPSKYILILFCHRFLYLRRIVGPKRDVVMGEWRKLHNEELHNSYSSSNIIRQMKSRRMRWTDVEEERKVYKVFDWKARRKESTRKTKA